MVDASIASATVAVLVTTLSTVVLSRLAPNIGLVDHPGGRKDHGKPIPVVGGIALAIALVTSEIFFGGSRLLPWFLAAGATLGMVSVWDDWKDIHHLPRFAGQVTAVLVMIFGAGVHLQSVGDLLGWRPIGLWTFAVPITIFAVVGVINALNMIDGMDGLAGSVSFVAFSWFGVAAVLGGLTDLSRLAWLLCGALAGFLWFNIRRPGQPRARVFLGDAGSTLLGFALAWFAIDLSQGPSRAIPPIAALWVVLLPLADTVSLMVRRRARGRSPFHPDREHIHHFLLAKGFSVNGALLVLVGVSVVFGAVGVIGGRMGVPEPVLFYAFAALFIAYHFAIKRAWKRLHELGLGAPTNTVVQKS